ncbi:MAG: SDR family NAD(P)-dependent oxidoreductase [Spirochaetaceae bacterium]|jgi:short-subunit dehydrogenase|nr:SDR family NAD(P)-dependent oxidoreductase [Spirochaetaceae bacterium]
MNIIITGSTRGIGQGMAIEFLKQGHNVLINGRNEEKTSQIQHKMQNEYPDSKVLYFACDVSDFPSVEKMYLYGEKEFGIVDIWINNAGMDQNREKIYHHNVEKMHQIIDVNIKGMVNGTRMASEKMKDHGGFIYNMEGFGSDGMILNKMSLYGMTKRALTYFTKSSAREVKDTNVKICRLSPGMVLTELLTSDLPEDPDERKQATRIFNILADTVEDVTPYLVKEMLAKTKNGASIQWLTRGKIFGRFFMQMFRKRRLPGLE